MSIDLKNISYRHVIKDDEPAIADICYRTGFMGKDLRGTNRFYDQYLFSLLFCKYYIRHEIKNCFVAVDDQSHKVVGYIIGSLDSENYYREFNRKIKPKVISRMFAYTLWRHPRTFLEMLKWNKNADSESARSYILEYPAHLHINLYASYQGKGIGVKLIRLFEEHIRSKDVIAVHLGANNLNEKAITFYQKLGFKVLRRNYFPFWSGVENHAEVIMGKHLTDNESS